ncbi:hypothetical protein ACTQZS_05100 [Bilifractor sp. LCP19S3_H10]|uniref:hypothetical protein n=1 Tax=Bilifractor sp. LCP19S3_H10 TaxID=3438736 RepID=UPI003F91A475
MYDKVSEVVNSDRQSKRILKMVDFSRKSTLDENKGMCYHEPVVRLNSPGFRETSGQAQNNRIEKHGEPEG